jgi:hypothetical protein
MNENLWAPWRMNYVTRTGDQQRVGNIFVELPAQCEDEKNGILYRGETAFVILNALFQWTFDGGAVSRNERYDYNDAC